MSYVPDDNEAALLLDSVDGEQDASRKAVMVDLLGRYRDTKAAAGLKPFQPDQAAQRQGRERLEGMFDGLDKVDSHLDPAQKAAFGTAVDASADRDEAKARMVNQSWVLAQYPQLNGAVDADWTSVKHHVAREVFGNVAEGIPDTAFYAQIGGHIKKQKAEREMLTDVLSKVQLEAAKGTGDWLSAWKKGATGSSSNPGWDPKNWDRYRTAAKKVFDETQQNLQTLRPAIAAGQEYYRLATSGPANFPGKKGADGQPVPKSSEEQDADMQAVGLARRTFLDEVMRLPTGQRQQALNLAVAGAADLAPKNMGEDGKAGGMEKIATSLDRAIGQFPTSVGRFAYQGVQAMSEMTQQARVAYYGEDPTGAGGLYNTQHQMQKADMSAAIDAGLVDAVDPIKSKSRLAQGMYDAMQSVPYMLAAGAQPEVGIPLTLAAMAEDNRRQFVANGVPAAEAVTLALAAAAPQVAIERLQANMLFHGRLPGAEKWLQKAVGTKLGLATKMLAVGGLENLHENFEEGLQDITPMVYQELGSILSKDVPDVNWKQELSQYAGQRVDTFFALLPMVLIGTGTASFKESAYGRQYLSSKKTLMAAGFTDAVAEEIAQVATKGDVEKAQAMVQAGWEDPVQRPKADIEKETAGAKADIESVGKFNTEEQERAFGELNDEMKASWTEQQNPAGAKAVKNEDGTWTVVDARGQYVDQAQTADHAVDLVREVDRADSANLTGVVDDMIDYFKQRGRGGPIEKTEDIRTLADDVEEGKMSQDRAQQLVDLYVELGALPSNTTVDEARIYGESARQYNAKQKIFEYVSRLHHGADPFVLVEEEAEGYFKQALDDAVFSLDDVEAWRTAVDGKQFKPKEEAAMRRREAVEWFSRYAQAYITGKVQESKEAPIPMTFRRWLDKMRKVFAEIFTLARDLIEQEKAGKLPGEFQKHLARAVGLDDAFLERQAREEERQEAQEGTGDQYTATEALMAIGLPTPNTDLTGMKGELSNLYESMKFDQRMKLFGRKRVGAAGQFENAKGLDEIAERLRADYGFSWVNGPDDVIKLAEDAFLRGKNARSDTSAISESHSLRKPKADKTADIFGQEDMPFNLDGGVELVEGSPALVESTAPFAKRDYEYAIKPKGMGKAFKVSSLVDARAKYEEATGRGAPALGADIFQDGHVIGEILSNGSIKLDPAKLEAAEKAYEAEHPTGQGEMTFAMRKQIETPEFKAWFEGSKVVDEYGDPRVVYHGTDQNFSVPGGKPGTLSAKYGQGDLWFAENVKLASPFIGGGRHGGGRVKAGSNIMPAFIAIKNPLDVSKNDVKTSMSLTQFLDLAGIPKAEHLAVLEEMERVVAPMREESFKDMFKGMPANQHWQPIKGSTAMGMAQTDEQLLNRHDSLYSLVEHEGIIRVLQARGYDGIKAREGIKYNDQAASGAPRVYSRNDEIVESVTWMPFTAGQIKSSTGNRGTFDRSNPDVTMALRRAQPLDENAPQTELPDGTRMIGPSTFAIRAYHGTPHKVDRFSTEKIGTGQGAQTYGWGLYFAENPKVAEDYRKNLGPGKGSGPEHVAARLLDAVNGDKEKALKEIESRRKSANMPGSNEKFDAVEKVIRTGEGLANLYTLELLPDPQDFLHWDKPLSEQGEKIKQASLIAAERLMAGHYAGKLKVEDGKLIYLINGRDGLRTVGQEWTGSDLHNALMIDEISRSDDEPHPPAPVVSKYLSGLGIPGIRYLDEGSRSPVKHGYLYGKNAKYFIQEPGGNTAEFFTGETEESRAKAKAAYEEHLERVVSSKTHNIVLFDDGLARILEENGQPVEGGQATFALRPAANGQLIAVHNTNAEKLRQMDELGGIATPSLAVIKHGTSEYDSFGDITLIAPPSLIDPRVSGRSKVFNADVYSPRFPNVRFQVSIPELRKAWDRLSKASKAIGLGTLSAQIDHDQVEREGLEAFKKADAVAVAFAEARGQTIKPVYRDNSMDVSGEAELMAFDGKSKWEIEDAPGFKEAASRYWAKQSAMLEKESGVELGEEPDYYSRHAAEAVYLAKHPEVHSGRTGDVARDWIKTEKLDDMFSQWIRNQFGNVIKGKVIRDYNENTGKTKNVPYELDAIVRLMKREIQGGEGFNYGVPSIRATVARRFTSLKDMKNSADSIIDKKQMEDVKEKFNQQFMELAEELRPYYRYESNRFGYLDEASTAFVELGANGYGIRKWEENYKDVPAELMDRIKAFMQALVHAPTEYFEAKIQRGVQLSELAGAVIPQDTPADVRQILKRHGIQTVEYKHGDEQARAAAVQQFGDASFAIGRESRAEDVQDAMRPRRIGIRVQASDRFSAEVKRQVGRPEYAVRSMETNEKEARKIIDKHDGSLAKLVQILNDPTQSLHPATKVALAFFVAEAANEVGDYGTAAEVAKQAAMDATSAGQSVNELKRWSVFTQPETCQQLLQTEIERENNRRKDREPVIQAVVDTYAEVQKEARKLLRQWLDEINGIADKKSEELEAVDVSSLPDVTFALRQEVRDTGLVKLVAKMLKNSGAEATERALVERYGAGVEKHLPDIFIEAQRSLTKREAKGEKKFKTRIPVLSDEQIEKTLRSTRGKEEEQQVMPTVEELKAQGMDEAQIEETMRQFRNRQEAQGDLIPPEDKTGRLTPEQIEAAMAEQRGQGEGAQQIADMPDLYDRLVEHLMSKIKARGEAENISVPRGIREQITEVLNRHGLQATPDDVKRIIGARQLLPNMTPAQAEELAGFAKRIASTPLDSYERGQQTMELFSYVHDQLAPYDMVDVAFGLWYANVLSSLLTSARNVTGNASMLFLDQAAETLFRNPASYFPYLEQLAKATSFGLEASAAQGKNTMKTGQEGLQRSVSLGDERRQGVLESDTAPLKTARTISRTATRFLSVQDLFFANTAYEMKARQIAWDKAKVEVKAGTLKPEQVEERVARLLNQATDQIQTFTDRAAVEWQNLHPDVQAEYDEANWTKRRVKELQLFERDKQIVGRALDFAQKVTLDFEPEGLLGLLMTNLSRVFSLAEQASQQVQNKPVRLLTKAAAKYGRTRVIPFMRVPVNVFNRVLDYGPVGYARSLMDAVGIPVIQGNKTRVRSAEERSDLLKRATLGTMALMPLALLCRPPAPDDEPEEYPWLQIHGAGSGTPNTNIALNGPKYRPYSLELRIGENKTFIDYRMFPLAPYLAAIGALHDRTRYKKEMDDKTVLVQGWILAQAMKEAFMSSSPITSLRELSEAAAENQPMSERAVNRTLARGSVGVVSNLIPLSGLWRSLDQLVGGDRNTRDTLLSASMAEIPIAGRLNLPSVDVLGDTMQNRAGIGWVADWSSMSTPESRIYRAFAEKDITPTDISRYQSKMTPEMYYEFSKARGALLKDALLSTNDAGETGLEHLLGLSDKAKSKDDDSPAKKYLQRVSRGATRRALAQVKFSGPVEVTPP